MMNGEGRPSGEIAQAVGEMPPLVREHLSKIKDATWYQSMIPDALLPKHLEGTLPNLPQGLIADIGKETKLNLMFMPDLTEDSVGKAVEIATESVLSKGGWSLTNVGISGSGPSTSSGVAFVPENRNPNNLFFAGKQSAQDSTTFWGKELVANAASASDFMNKVTPSARRVFQEAEKSGDYSELFNFMRINVTERRGVQEVAVYAKSSSGEPWQLASKLNPEGLQDRVNAEKLRIKTSSMEKQAAVLLEQREIFDKLRTRKPEDFKQDYGLGDIY